MTTRTRNLVLALILALLMVSPGGAPLAQEQRATRVVAWSSGVYNFYGSGYYMPPPNCGAGMGELTAIALGAHHALGLRADGTVVSWLTDSMYMNLPGYDVPPGLTDVTAIAAGVQFSLALRRDGTVVSWGQNQSPSDGGPTPKVPAGLTDVSAIAAAAWHALALKADGTVVAWDPYRGSNAVPSGLRDVVAIAAGHGHSLAVRRDGTVVAWGTDYGDGATRVPTGLRGVTAVAGGMEHSVALKADGTVVAWGAQGADPAFSGPQVQVPAGLSQVVAIAAGSYHTLALRADGTVVEWGTRWTGAPPVLSGVTAIAAGEYHNLALTSASPGVRPLMERVIGDVAFERFGDRFRHPDQPVPVSVAVSKATSETADTVLVARDDVYADALAGGPLAVQVDGPLLLTESSALDDLVSAEIQRLGASEAVLLGGEAALEPAVEQALVSMGLTTRRLGGADRFATAVLIAAELDAWTEAFLAEGRHPDPRRGWPDALSGAALAGAAAGPILLVERDRIPPITLDTLQGAETATVLGGPAAISTDVADEVAQHVDTVDRLAGDHRTTTATAVADEAVRRGMTVERAWVATGWDWPHALVAAPAAGRSGGVVLLTHPHDPTVAVSWIERNRARLARLSITGSSTPLYIDGAYTAGWVPVEADERICDALYR
jgi:putative cell wall-binding protein